MFKPPEKLFGRCGVPPKILHVPQMPQGLRIAGPWRKCSEKQDQKTLHGAACVRKAFTKAITGGACRCPPLQPSSTHPRTRWEVGEVTSGTASRGAYPTTRSKTDTWHRKRCSQRRLSMETFLPPASTR